MSVLSLFSHIRGFSYLIHIHHNVGMPTKIPQWVHMLRIMIRFHVSSVSHAAVARADGPAWWVLRGRDVWIVSRSNIITWHVWTPCSVHLLFTCIMGFYLLHIHHNVGMLAANQLWGYTLRNMICFDIQLLSHVNASHSRAKIHGQAHMYLEASCLLQSMGECWRGFTTSKWLTVYGIHEASTCSRGDSLRHEPLTRGTWSSS